jgi:hypothetical protein
MWGLNKGSLLAAVQRQCHPIDMNNNKKKLLREAGSLLYCLDNQDFPVVIDLECALQPSQNPDP